MKMRQILGRKVVRKPQELFKYLNLKEYYEKRNKILIFRGCGGLGDILMHRMIFEDFKKIMPDCELHFACPEQYHTAVADHPFVDKVISSEKVDYSDYLISYNTTNACGRYELMMAPLADKHRSDIWAEHCGVELTAHNMHIKLTEEEIKRGKEIVERKRNGKGPIIALAPISAMPVKDLLSHQIKCIIDHVKQRDAYIFTLHYHPIRGVDPSIVPYFAGINLREWMGILYAADYVISVDTSAGHFAGGIGKPLLSIFTFADGKVYTKYYPNTILVQKHRDNGDWDCGPCYNWSLCPKTQAQIKPCLTEISNQMIKDGIDKLFARFPYDKMELPILQ
jgi:ADP-heptose:LPS heptosyltransferase